MQWSDFVAEWIGNPFFCVTAIFTVLVIVVNGWTDAPNAIATCVSTRAMGPRAAIIMAALCNLAGIVVMTSLNATVAQTIYHMVDFGHNAHDALIALCAALCAIVLWASAAWAFGIPTSESHALIAGLSGAAIAIHKGFAGIHIDEWIKVIYGLLLSSGLGFVGGFVAAKLTAWLFSRRDRCKAARFFQGAQICSAASMAFMHGAQDGQKFISVFLLGLCLARGDAQTVHFTIPLWLMLFCALIMALGTCIGGYRIIKTVGMRMVKIEPYQGFASDLGAVGCLLFSSLSGVPVSTTHTKTTALMGVGAAKRVSSVNWGTVNEMCLAWILTFPGCACIGYLMASLFLKIFS